MKVTLDLDHLLAAGHISSEEYSRLSALAAESTGSLAYNILLGFGVVAVSGAAIALAPDPLTAVVLGILVLVGALLLARDGGPQWQVLAAICTLTGALMTGAGVLWSAEVSQGSLLAVTGLFAVTAVFARSSLLSVLATLMLGATIGAGTAYIHAGYFLWVESPLLTVLVFSVLAVLLYQLSKQLAPEYEAVAIAAARTSVFMVNLGFWIGSLWGDALNADDSATFVSAGFLSLLWGLALLAAAIWAWRRNRRWLLNTVAVFGGIHFYTQWFERLGATPASVLLAGLLALGLALCLRNLNGRMRTPA
jgi:iron complex transport system permease protein